ncbi:MAG: carboxymuconolactone decarboxylase family protein [Sphingomonadales bacterium]
MSRVRLLDQDEMDPDIREMCAGIEAQTGDSTGMRVLAHRPDIVRHFVGFYWPLQTEGLLGRKLVELMRFAVAQINQCQSCLSARYQDSFDEGLTEALIAALPEAETSDLFSPREKAAIRYAQKMASDHFSVGDEDFIRLHEHFSEKEIVELCMDVAQFIGIGRTFAVLDARNTQCVIPEALLAKAG